MHLSTDLTEGKDFQPIIQGRSECKGPEATEENRRSTLTMNPSEMRAIESSG